MKDKKYLDKVLGYMVRSTKINYDGKRVYVPFSPLCLFVFPNPSFPLLSPDHYLSTFYDEFSSYCENTFGLTKEEMEYVWKEYVDIINDKIENGK